MTKYYDAMKVLINPQMIRSASSIVGESETNVSKAVSGIISGLMGIMLKKGNSLRLSNILEEAGNLNILTHEENIFQERPTENQQRLGDDFLQHLLGDKAADFSNPIAKDSNISSVATNRLVSMIAPILAGFLGNKMVKENNSLTQILSEIDSEKDKFAPNVPAGVVSNFGLGSVLGAKAKADAKKSSSWIIWIVIIALLVILFFWWRSCRDNTNMDDRNRPMVTDTVAQGRSNMSTNNNRQAMYRDTMRRDDGFVRDTTTVTTTNTYRDRNANRQTEELTLSNNTKITVYKGGVEEEMINYLKSDNYKNASDKDLQSKWFEFDNLDFTFGSSTELTAGAKRQVDNIIAILKSNKNAKIKIAGFADKKGTEDANMKVSQERAKTIENLLEKGGVGSQVVKTEGYSDEYAKHSAKESNAQRAEDRNIAIRFVK